MRIHSIQAGCLRNDRLTWLTVASILASCGFASSVSAQTLSIGSTPGGGPVLAQQLSAATLGPGWAGGSLDGGRDYTDNGGPAGQTFTLATGGVLGSVSVQNGLDNGVQSTAANTSWIGQTLSIQIGSVNGSGVITPIDTETATWTAAPTAGTGAAVTSPVEFLTFNLATPVTLSAGQLYEFSLAGTASYWYGLAHSAADVYSGGTAFNNNLTTANTTTDPKFTFNGTVAPNPTGYDYVFSLNGVPEPTSFALLSLGGLALTMIRKRRHA
jgi:hypothetical protein